MLYPIFLRERLCSVFMGHLRLHPSTAWTVACTGECSNPRRNYPVRSTALVALVPEMYLTWVKCKIVCFVCASMVIQGQKQRSGT